MYIVVPIIDQFSKTETLSSSKFDGIKHHLSGQDQRLHPNPPRFFFCFFFSFATIALSTNSSSFYEHYVWEKLSFAMKFDLLISSPSKPAYQ